MYCRKFFDLFTPISQQSLLESTFVAQFLKKIFFNLKVFTHNFMSEFVV